MDLKITSGKKTHNQTKRQSIDYAFLKVISLNYRKGIIVQSFIKLQ